MATINLPIDGRYTPWDERVFSRKTFEILSIAFDDEEKVNNALASNNFCDAELIYGRFKADDFKVKSALIKNGYIACEVTHRVCLPNLQSYILPELFSRKLLNIDEGNAEDFDTIKQLAFDMFAFSRFHEDPFIDNELANARMSSWVNDLKSQNVKLLVYRDLSGNILSFMIYDLIDNVVNLILGGSIKGKELYSPFFWGSVIAHIQKSEPCKRIQTVISAANTGVISLYIKLGFQIFETNIDYHKHIEG